MNNKGADQTAQMLTPKDRVSRIKAQMYSPLLNVLVRIGTIQLFQLYINHLGSAAYLSGSEEFSFVEAVLPLALLAQDLKKNNTLTLKVIELHHMSR